MKRRGIEPIIATLLLVAIAVAAAVIVYVFATSLAGGLTSGGGTQVTEQLSMDANVYSPVSSGVAIYLRNTGTSTVTIDSTALFFDGLVATDTHTGFSGTACQALSTSYTVPVGTVCYLSFSGSAQTGATAGTSHTIKVVDKTGGTFVFTVIAGRSG